MGNRPITSPSFKRSDHPITSVPFKRGNLIFTRLLNSYTPPPALGSNEDHRMSKWLQGAANFIAIASFPFAPWSTFVCLSLGAVYLSADIWQAVLYTQLPSERISRLEREIYVLECEIFTPNHPFLGKHRRVFVNAIHMCVPSGCETRYSIFSSYTLVLKAIYLIARFDTSILLSSAGLTTSWRLWTCTRIFLSIRSTFIRSRMIFRLAYNLFFPDYIANFQKRTAEKEKRRVNREMWMNA
jgi:hypothetical protein